MMDKSVSTKPVKVVVARSLMENKLLHGTKRTTAWTSKTLSNSLAASSTAAVEQRRILVCHVCAQIVVQTILCLSGPSSMACTQIRQVSYVG